MQNIDFLQDLNIPQQQAVTYIDGPQLVIAGAGSGKTRVLTYKIAYLLSKGVSPASILALTFTNKAAREMRRRIGELVGTQTSRYLWMGTFHSVFAKILRNDADRLGYGKDFSIYDTSDSKSLIKSIIKELKLDEKIYRVGFIQNRISYAKNRLITADAYYKDTDIFNWDNMAKIPKTKAIYALYAQRCKKANAMDFDDLLMQTNLLFYAHPDVLEKYRNIFSYILVDEYQDTNFSQYRIVKQLAEVHQRICVVGDDAQSIYSFRGADITNILNFQRTYNHAKLFKLEQNYRSTQNIVKAANSLITRNSKQIEKVIFSEKQSGELIKVSGVMTDKEEAVYVANNIKQMHRSNEYNYQNFAVLYRTNSQSRVMEDELRKMNIPYRIYGGLSFYQRKEIKDMVAYFRLISNCDDEEALKRIINTPARGIGNVTLNKLLDTAHTHQVGVWSVLEDMLAYNLPVNAGTAKKLTKFRDMINDFAVRATTTNAYELATDIVKQTDIVADAITDRSAENLSRMDNIDELLRALHDFSEMKKEEDNLDFLPIADFLAEVSLLSDQDTNKDDDDERVTLMTIHAAKGLEYKNVFIVGVEENLFPSPFAQSVEELEEERRLFYVAITRAEENCFISYAKSRFKNGQTNFAGKSRFIDDIDSQYLDVEKEIPFLSSETTFFNTSSSNQYKNDAFQQNNRKFSTAHATGNPASYGKRLTKIDTNVSEKTAKQVVENKALPVGTFVKHHLFGIGKVIETSISNGNEKADIDFGEKGVKSLLLKFAKLEILK